MAHRVKGPVFNNFHLHRLLRLPTDVDQLESKEMLFSRLVALALLLCSCGTAEVRSLTILHTNDLHARISPLDNHNGGFAYLATAVQRERANCKDCIFLNAGDLVQGSPVSTIFHGMPVYEIGNLLGFDVATFGNHEFDYGWPQARKFQQTAKYPMVACNIVNGRGQLFADKPYTILTVNGCGSP
jgi:5'-nucleotidase / UDP-sugar diphosphatase